MKNTIALLALGLACLLQPSVARAQETDKKEILKKARQSYANLKERGLVEFKAQLAPNWELILKEQSADAKVFEATLAKLKEIKFAMTYSAQGAVKVTHEGEPAAENPKQAAGLKQIYGGMSQTVSGFFMTWTPFMQSPPLPELETDFKLVEKDDLYRLTYKEGGADVETTLGKDYALRELKVVTPDFASTLKPTFQKTPEGWVLTGYDATYEGPGSSTSFKAVIENKDAGGFPLPSKLNFKGTFNKSPIAMEIAFTDYEVKKR